MDNMEIAKKAVAIAYMILNSAKDLKNDVRFGHDLNIKQEAQDITEECAELSNLILPMRFA